MQQDVAARADARPRVIVFPPVIPLSGFSLGLLLEQLRPVAPWSPLLRGVGAAVFCLGIAGFAWMIVTMKRARTPIHNSATPTTLVEHGPFHWTRNPMYLLGAVAYAGAALALSHPWSLALLPAVLLTTHFGVVRREEALLEDLFGDAYRQYKTRVRRWV